MGSTLSNKLSFVILSITVQSFLMISIALIIYLDTVIFDHGASEYSLTQFTQEGLIFVSVIIFFALSKNQPESRGFLVLCGGFFSVMLIRELDGFFDEIKHGFWVYPAIVVTLITLIYARKSPGTVSGPLVHYFQTSPFVYITIGLLIVILFSRIFGSGIIWRVVMADNYTTVYKAIIQEGVELLGYVIVFYGSVMLWITRTVLNRLHQWQIRSRRDRRRTSRRRTAPVGS